MKWCELSNEASSILECMWSFYNDKPKTFSLSIGETYKSVNKEYTFTEEVYNEIIKYHKLQQNEGTVDAEWEVSRTGDVVTFKGGKWFKIDENGTKKYYED